jgi:hypothetical protein
MSVLWQLISCGKGASFVKVRLGEFVAGWWQKGETRIGFEFGAFPAQ